MATSDPTIAYGGNADDHLSTVSSTLHYLLEQRLGHVAPGGDNAQQLQKVPTADIIAHHQVNGYLPELDAICARYSPHRYTDTKCDKYS